MAQQGSRPPGSGRRPAAGGLGGSRVTGGNSWDDPAGTDEEYPPWAGPAVGPRRAEQRETGRRNGLGSPPDLAAPGFRRRMAAERSRRRSLITWVWGGAAVLVAVIVAGLVFVLGGHSSTSTSSGGLVTTFQPGEFQAVPSSCTSVAPATLNQYLPGKRRVIAPHSLDGNAQSLCTWTLDARPVYRVLEVTVQAYAPSGLASGDGSATFAAVDAYRQALQTLRHPAKATHLPPATVTAVPKLGTGAFAALQVVLARGDATDIMTVVARDRNVVATVVLQGPHVSHGGYAPAPVAQLQAGAIAAARNVVSRLH